MWKRLIDLFLVLLVVILIEAGLLPGIHSQLRVDLFVGIVIGLVVYFPFVEGFVFVVVSSVLMQAFSVAGLGYLPFVYTFTYLGLDLVKGLIYLENTLAQCVMGFVCSLLIVSISVFFADMSLEGISAIVVGALLSGLVSPLMVRLVRQMQVTYES